MVLNAAVQMLREADELKEKILKFKSGTSMLQERNLWATQQQLQKVYHKVLILDLEYALDKKVEQDLWNIGFKQQIEALQAISKDKKNPLRSEGQAMLSWVLQAAGGFYLCLLHQICTTFHLDLPFRRRASLVGWVEGWGAGGEAADGARLPAPQAARYICQHCLVHLGDLARYRHQLRVAHTFYRHALVVCVHSGQPYNQLALVAWARARRLAALYWHVRSLLVRAPFPPAPPNLARTLRAAALHRDNKELPVLPGLTVTSLGRDGVTSEAPPPVTSRLDAHSYVTELIRALHYIHTLEELDKATTIVNTLNSSLTTLIATDSFESMTLVRMGCVLIWLVQSSTEDLTVEPSAMTESEAIAAKLSLSLASGALLALLLPSYTADAPVERALPAVKLWLEWWACRGAAWSAQPALWPALAHTLNLLAGHTEPKELYATVPLPEDEELHGFLPIEEYLQKLRFPNHATWDTYGARVPGANEQLQNDLAADIPACSLQEPAMQRKLRAHRLVQLGKRLAEMRPEQLSYDEDEEKVVFRAGAVCGEQLSLALAELWAGPGGGAGTEGGAGSCAGADSDASDSDDERPSLKPPTVISEADFREKVREKRVGILKPQGSLERAREERAMATQDEPDEGSEESSKSEDKKESRKPRVNIAMAAIMRKQEETNKQVKFVTPPLTPVSAALETNEAMEEKPKVIQPKAIKSLANLPLGRKTGGILSLKDKSAGYPHLVNAEPEPKKVEKDDKKEVKPQTPPNYQPKKQETSSPSWTSLPQQSFQEQPRMTFQKGYVPPGVNYTSNYQPNTNNQGIRLPVVNPKEIDVRTAALQKQSSRQELFQDGHQFNPNYQMSGDKKNFLNDLPPRFANQYRYWQTAQENQFNDNKFRDDNFKPANNNVFPPRTNWLNQPQLQENYQQGWWKPDSPNFNYTAPINPPNYFSPLNSTIPNPYQNMSPFNQMQNNMGGNKVENMGQPYLPSTIGQPMQTLQNLVSSPNFNSSLNSFNAYPPTVAYDSAMYPQFGKMGYQMQKPPNFQVPKDMMDLGMSFGNGHVDMQQRNLSFNDKDGEANMESNKVVESASSEASNTYSLFSGAPAAAPWGAAHTQPPQSLWSGPGPSPLERLLEQQKLMKHPSAPQ